MSMTRPESGVRGPGSFVPAFQVLQSEGVTSTGGSGVPIRPGNVSDEVDP